MPTLHEMLVRVFSDIHVEIAILNEVLLKNRRVPNVTQTGLGRSRYRPPGDRIRLSG